MNALDEHEGLCAWLDIGQNYTVKIVGKGGV